jgi:hypothetical protein
MAGDDLISSYLDDLGARLPSGIVEELADGLIESYERIRQQGADDVAAAALALHDFGDADHLVAEFVRQSAGRRTAGLLLLSGPAIGLVWGMSLVVTRAWSWPIPLVARVGFATILVSTILALAIARLARTWRQASVAAYAATGLIVLDVALIGVALTVAPSVPWILSLAVAVSVTRSGLAARSIPRIVVP